MSGRMGLFQFPDWHIGHSSGRALAARRLQVHPHLRHSRVLIGLMGRLLIPITSPVLRKTYPTTIGAIAKAPRSNHAIPAKNHNLNTIEAVCQASLPLKLNLGSILHLVMAGDGNKKVVRITAWSRSSTRESRFGPRFFTALALAVPTEAHHWSHARGTTLNNRSAPA